jgi:hypothetical protein
VDETVSASVKGNVFYAAEQPAFDVVLVNRQEAPADVTVVCAITDYEGRQTERRATVRAPGRQTNSGRDQARIPLNMERLGYFDAIVTATLADGREIWGG